MRRPPPIYRVDLSFLARLPVIADIRDVLTQALNASGVRRDDCFRIISAVDELSTNIVRHGYSRGRSGVIELSVAVQPDRIRLAIGDRAARFDPRGGKLPDWQIQVTRGRTGGMGRFLVEHMADGVKYRPRRGGGNLVSLVFRRGAGFPRN